MTDPIVRPRRLSQPRWPLNAPLMQTSPAYGDALAVVASDSLGFGEVTGVRGPRVATGLYLGGDDNGDGGDVEIRTPAGEDVIFTAVPAGTILPVACTHVLPGGTDHTSAVALFAPETAA